MEPIFTLSYSEFRVAQELRKEFPSKDGYSVYVPLSRQEKGVDLILSHRSKGKTKTITIQIKASRTYQEKKFNTWFNTFDVPEEADYVFLFAVYPLDPVQKSRKSSSRWASVIMVFTNSDKKKFIKSVKTTSGKPDRMFGYGFDDDKKIKQTRGDRHRKSKDYSKHLLIHQISNIKKSLQ
jgi:hypothetical protein